jgi:hypothetical protein
MTVNDLLVRLRQLASDGHGKSTVVMLDWYTNTRTKVDAVVEDDDPRIIVLMPE